MNTQLITTNEKLKITKNALIIDENVSDEQLGQIYKDLDMMNGSSLFWLGDILNVITARHGENYTKLLTSTNYAYKTLANAKSMCAMIPPALRTYDLPFSFYSEAYYESGKDIKLALKYLKTAEEEKLTRSNMRKLIRLELAENIDDEDDIKITKDSEMIAVMDSLATIRRFLNNSTSQTLDIKIKYVVGEIEEIYELSQGLVKKINKK